jgi:cytochrome P450
VRDISSYLREPWASKLNAAKPRLVEALSSLSLRSTAPWRDAPPLAGGFLPFFGYALEYGIRGPEVLRELRARHGDVFSLRMIGRNITFCLSREAVEYLYEAPYEEVSFLDGIRLFRGFGTVIRLDATGPEEANVGLETLRRYLAPRVHEAVIELDREVRSTLLELAGASPTESVELRGSLGRITARLSSSVLMGPRLARDPAFLDAAFDFDDATQQMVMSVFSSRPLERAAQCRDRLEGHILEELARRRAAVEHEPQDFIDALLAARDAHGRPLSDRQLASDLGVFTFATTANTPAAVTMCLLQILSNPALRVRVESELEALLEQNGDVLDTAALKRLKLLEACLHETLRMYSPGIHLRMLRHEVRMGAYTLPSGSLIAVSPYVLHRDPSMYEDPEVFDPDRFLDGPRRPAMKPSAMSFVPFGRGLHACVGRTLARAEVMLTVARVLTDWKPALVPLTKPLATSWATAGMGMPNQAVYIKRRDVGPGIA